MTKPIKGRGAVSNRASRFDEIKRERVDDGWYQEEEAPPRTEVMPDSNRSIITYNESPDIPFDRSINPYKGCEHACAYCYARPSHAYLGLSPGLDFETKLFAKFKAAELLRQELAKPRYRPAPISLGANTDPYQPVERKLRITRAVLQVLHDTRHPVAVITKSALIERDIDLLAPMAERNLAQAAVSVTTLSADLSRRLEPRATAPHRRLRAIKTLAEAGIPVTVMFAPVIPALNDAEMEDVLGAAREAGARSAAFVLLRLPREVNEIFEEWLAVHEPGKAQHVMSLVQQMREGRHNQSEFGARMTGKGLFAQLLQKRFRLACSRLGLNRTRSELDCSQFRPPPVGGQLSLF
ncbi:radical SAM protein [Alkalilimnicola ehrlichii]|nr:PA0069 family radical SAM protein [Alkalilimnicola ehrlichii]RFA29422.1 radical SAM protein [Alkalilimnicola ehrlichii]